MEPLIPALPTRRTGSVTSPAQSSTRVPTGSWKRSGTRCYGKTRLSFASKKHSYLQELFEVIFGALNDLRRFLLSLSVLLCFHPGLLCVDGLRLANHLTGFVQRGWALPPSGTPPLPESFSVYTYTQSLLFSFPLNWGPIPASPLLSPLRYTRPKCKSTSNPEWKQ